MLGLGTSLASIDSHLVHKELSELDNFADLDIWFDFSRTSGNQDDNITTSTNLGNLGTGGASRSFTDATCDYNNDTAIAMDSTVGIAVSMEVSGTGIPEGAYVEEITSATEFLLSASTTGGSVTNGTLTFTSTATSYNIDSAGGTPDLELSVMGRRSIAFDGTNDTLNTTAVYTTTGKPMTVLLVCHCTDISGGNDFIVANAEDDGDISHLRFRSGGASVQTRWSDTHAAVTTVLDNTAGTTANYTIANNVNMAMVLRRDSDGKLYVYADSDGVIGKKSNTNNDAPANFRFGAIGGTSEATADYTGFIGEFALYDVDLGEAKILTMLEEICKKWGIDQ